SERCVPRTQTHTSSGLLLLVCCQARCSPQRLVQANQMESRWFEWQGESLCVEPAHPVVIARSPLAGSVVVEWRETTSARASHPVFFHVRAAEQEQRAGFR